MSAGQGTAPESITNRVGVEDAPSASPPEQRCEIAESGQARRNAACGRAEGCDLLDGSGSRSAPLLA